MNNFKFCSPTKLIFGTDAQHKIGAEVARYAKKVLLHYGGGSILRSGLYDEVVASLKEAGVEFVELGGAVPNPRLNLVYEGVELCKKEGVELVLAVGGGSAIDSGKAIALGACTDKDVWDFFRGRYRPEKALPVATVLTLPATGSETSQSAVITQEETQRKLGLNSDLIRPVVSAVNPTLFMTLPQEQVSNGICDILIHMTERYFTRTVNTDYTDALTEAAMKVVMDNGAKLKKDIKDYDAWANLALAGTFAHNGLMGLGREEDWASHRIEHELSAVYDVAHGAGLAVVVPAWMKYVYKKHVPIFHQFAVNVMNIRCNFRNHEEVALAGIEALEKYFRDIGLPTTLGELGIDDENLEMLAKKATTKSNGDDRPLGSLEKIYWRDALTILEMAR